MNYNPPTGRSVGRPAKPVEQKRRMGNPGKRPLGDVVYALPAITEPPEPRRPLGQHGRAMWDTAWTAGAYWLNAEADKEVVLMLCEQIDERLNLRVKVFMNGDKDDRKALRMIDAQVMAGLSALGFTPTDRARMGFGGHAEANALDDLRRARTA